MARRRRKASTGCAREIPFRFNALCANPQRCLSPWSLYLLSLPRCAALALALVACSPAREEPPAAPPRDAGAALDASAAVDASAPIEAQRWVQVSVGNRHGCGVTGRQQVVCWGDNEHGAASPPTDQAFIGVTVGEQHSCGITTSAQAVCWGLNNYGQAGAPAGNFSRVSAGWAHSCGVMESGELTCWGLNTHGQASPPQGRSWARVSAAVTHTCGVTTDGAVICWGSNRFGESSPPEGQRIVAVTTARAHSCGIDEAGAVRCWGSESNGMLEPVEGVRYRQLDAASYHTCGLSVDGQALCFGWNDDGQNEPPEGLSFATLSAGGATSCGVTQDGEARCWGRDDEGQASPPDLSALPPSTDPSPIGEPAAPASYCAGSDRTLDTCAAEVNYDPWIASTGETHYWIRHRKTGVIPFLPTYEAGVDVGFLQITSGMATRDPQTEDIFHLWFSTTPNGPALEGTRCAWYTQQARGSVYWSWREEHADSVCILPKEPQVLYVNFETRCYAPRYDGACDDVTKQKSDRTYQFDIARGLVWR